MLRKLTPWVLKPKCGFPQLSNSAHLLRSSYLALTNGGSLMNVNDFPPQLHAIRANSTFLPVWDLMLTSQMALFSFESPSSLCLMQNHENHHNVTLFISFQNAALIFASFIFHFLISLYSQNVKKEKKSYTMKFKVGCVIALVLPFWFIQWKKDLKLTKVLNFHDAAVTTRGLILNFARWREAALRIWFPSCSKTKVKKFHSQAWSHDGTQQDSFIIRPFRYYNDALWYYALDICRHEYVESRWQQMIGLILNEQQQLLWLAQNSSLRHSMRSLSGVFLFFLFPFNRVNSQQSQQIFKEKMCPLSATSYRQRLVTGSYDSAWVSTFEDWLRSFHLEDPELH